MYLRTKKHYRSEVDLAKKVAVGQFIENAKNPCKAAWSIINGNRKKDTTFKCKSSPDEINNYFIQSVSDIVDNMQDRSVEAVHNVASQVAVHACLSRWDWVSPDYIMNIVSRFKSSTSTDVYGVNTVFLKQVISSIATPLAYVLNLCLEQGIFPEELKISKTVPVFKKGDPDLMSSYRPISIIPTLAKILETIVQVQLQSYFEDHNLFNNMQFGFRKGRSTVSAVDTLVQEVHQAFEEKDSILLTLVDLSKAFDCVPHETLLQKLFHYKVRDSALQLLRSYLTGRRQVVNIHGAISSAAVVKWGVPQGSALGPLLFLILVNDLDLNSKALLYADDTTLISRGSTMSALDVESMELLEEAKLWFGENSKAAVLSLD